MDMIDEDLFSDLEVALMLVMKIIIVSIQTFILITDKSNIWTGKINEWQIYSYFQYNVSPAWPDLFTKCFKFVSHNSYISEHKRKYRIQIRWKKYPRH